MNLCIDIPPWLDALAEPGRVAASDEDKMALPVALARENVRLGCGPFGAVVFHRPSGRVVAGGVNLVLSSGLSLMHAEITAIMSAQRRVGGYSLDVDGGHELFTSSEPCAMCLGAIFWSGVRRVVFGAPCQAARDIGFDEGPVFPETWDYVRGAGIEVLGGVLEDEARGVLEAYREAGGVIYNP